MKTDADFQTTDFIDQATIESWLKKQGICAHGNLRRNECLFCGKTFKSFETACAERREILDDYL